MRSRSPAKGGGASLRRNAVIMNQQQQQQHQQHQHQQLVIGRRGVKTHARGMAGDSPSSVPPPPPQVETATPAVVLSDHTLMHHHREREHQDTSLFERQLLDGMRRREMETYVRRALALICGGVYAYQRLQGLQQIEQLLAQLLCDRTDTGNNKQLRREQIERDIRLFDDLHSVVSKQTNAVAAIVSTVVMRAQRAGQRGRGVGREEIQRALVVLEGCCLLSPMCSITLAAVQGVKQLTLMAGDNAMGLSKDRLTDSDEEGDEEEDVVLEEEDWEDIRVMCIDVLEACVQNSVQNVLFFCQGEGVEPIASLIRDSNLSIMLRSKAVEFIVLLLRIVRRALKADHKRITEKAFETLSKKLDEYLGGKLADELKRLEVKTVPSRTKDGEVVDLHGSTFDHFIANLDK